ncbi:hypothetical protein J3R83DRAFT_6608 [Lanmaoa asiatica]|nr:hypothetical protein J3R83DRAFT_6608 [Lanmaoa asiatica]
MLADISKATTLYLTPILMLTSLFLTLFAYLAPVAMLHNQVSLLTVTPSSALTQPSSNQAVDGPSMLLGMLGRSPVLEWMIRNSHSYRILYQAERFSKSDLHIALDPPSLHFDAIDASVFTSNTPSSVLAAPPTVAPVFLAISLAFSIIFFIMFTGISFRHLMGKAGNIWENPMVQRASAWIGISSFLVGLASFLIIRMYFGKAADDFNQSIQGQGVNGPQLIANTSNAFTMVWVGYAFFAVPVVVSLAKLHVLATK